MKAGGWAQSDSNFLILFHLPKVSHKAEVPSAVGV